MAGSVPTAAMARRWMSAPILGSAKRTSPGRLAMTSLLVCRCYSSSIPPSKQQYVPSSGTYPQGFRVGGVRVGVKPSSPASKPDIALVVSDVPCAAAAVFTKNKFQAAPVTFSRELLQRTGNQAQAVLVNSGCANAVTGKGGLEDAAAMARASDACVGDKEDNTIVMSTGVIGQRLPIQKIVDGVPAAYQALGTSHDHWLTCARAICTTDTFPKLLSRTFQLPSTAASGIKYRLAGLTKGAGMIHPNMATLLGILATDAPLAPALLQPLLRHAVDHSFNSITIDGDTSTNDTIALLANGAAGGPPISDIASADYDAFRAILSDFAALLAQLVVRDGEGATKFVTVRVTDAASAQVARRVASVISRSPLVKTALYGCDANWGRILCATGYALIGEPGESDDIADAAILPARTSVSFIPTDGTSELRLLVDGEPQPVDEARAAEILALEDLEILVRLGSGREQATYWTCDFSKEYVAINGDYRT